MRACDCIADGNHYQFILKSINYSNIFVVEKKNGRLFWLTRLNVIQISKFKVIFDDISSR